MKRALFLDRDGILDHLVWYADSGEYEAPRTVDDLRIIEGFAAPLRELSAAGWLLFIVTNQPTYAKGKAPMASLEAVHSAVMSRLAADWVDIVKSYVCFHHPEAGVAELRIACECRKPGTKSLRDAAAEFDVDLSASWMVGDQDSDLRCGRAAGCRVALIEHPGSIDKRGEVEPDVRCRDLEELVAVLLGE